MSKLQKIDEFSKNISRMAKEWIAHLIFGAVIALMVVLSFVQLGEGTGRFNWLSLGINTMLQISIFIPYYWRQKRLSGQGGAYKANKEVYAQKVQNVSANNRLGLFAEFCEIKTEELKLLKQIQMVNAVGVEKSVFLSGNWHDLTNIQKATCEQAKHLVVKPINPLTITSNSSGIKGLGLEFNDTVEDTKNTIKNLIPKIVWAAALAYIGVDGFKNGGAEAIVTMLFRLVICVMSMFSGIMNGDRFIQKKDKVIIRRVDFLNLFNEWIIAREEAAIVEARPAEEHEITAVAVHEEISATVTPHLEPPHAQIHTIAEFSGKNAEEEKQAAEPRENALKTAAELAEMNEVVIS